MRGCGQHACMAHDQHVVVHTRTSPLQFWSYHCLLVCFVKGVCLHMVCVLVMLFILCLSPCTGCSMFATHAYQHMHTMCVKRCHDVLSLCCTCKNTAHTKTNVSHKACDTRHRNCTVPSPCTCVFHHKVYTPIHRLLSPTHLPSPHISPHPSPHKKIYTRTYHLLPHTPPSTRPPSTHHVLPPHSVAV